jgi:hypothetical protein
VAHNKRYACVLAAVLAAAALGQTPESTPAATSPAPATAAKPWNWNAKGVDFYVLGDVYYSGNFNNPDPGFNQLYNFDIRANSAHLNMAKFSMEKASGMVGFRVDVGAGQTFSMMSATDPGPDGMKYLEQAYFEFRPKNAHGLQLDFGKFVTSAGAEVIETNSNWNYSRSLLFAWAIPYYHMGLRATMPVTKNFTAGVQLVNGWNDVKDNNSGKTVGLVANYAWKKATWSNNYYSGPEKTDTNKGFRQLYDTTLLVNPTEKFSAYFNFDYGVDKNIGAGRATWTGFAVAARYQLTPRFAIAPRAEIFDDKDGFSTGVAQNVKEVTLTGEMKLRDGLFTRLEFRHDASDKPFFNRATGDPMSKNQNTITIGLIAFFGPKK